MKLFQYLTVSLLIHGLIWALFADSTPVQPGSQPVEVVILEKKPAPETNARQLVTDPTERLNEAVKKLEKQAKLLSRHTRRVEEERVQRGNVGTPQLGKPQRPKAVSSSERKQASPWDPPPLAGPGLAAREELQRTAKEESELSPVQLGASALQEFLPEVKSGSFTSLNTDQFLFYTFYARINEQIRNRWVENLRRFANGTDVLELDRLSHQQQVTEVEILLDPNGRYVKTIYHNHSQNTGLDEAASLAFPMAQPFVNPPTEIVQDDGYIHLHYSFHVYWRPRSWARETN